MSVGLVALDGTKLKANASKDANRGYQGFLFVIDGAKALRKAIRTVFGDAPVQRCLRHKERKVLDHRPSASGRQ